MNVSWQSECQALTIRWVETGRTAASAPVKGNGLGSVLIRNTVRGQFNGKLDYDWKHEGLDLTLELKWAATAPRVCVTRFPSRAT